MTAKTDRELLELAAKTVGLVFWEENEWNPLADDGTALRLAVKLELLVHVMKETSDVTGPKIDVCERHGDDPYAATRRAIVRAAAEVGEGMLTHDEFVLMFPDRFEEAEVERAAAAIGETL